jgi:23S rRNA maturation-related 3'-5' exoribonuclease YhaM
MIKDKEIAENISKLMLDITARLNDSLLEVQEKCSKDEFEKYRRGVAHILAYIATEVLNPLYRLHPDIRPEEYYLPDVPKKE